MSEPNGCKMSLTNNVGLTSGAMASRDLNPEDVQTKKMVRLALKVSAILITVGLAIGFYFCLTKLTTVHTGYDVHAGGTPYHYTTGQLATVPLGAFGGVALLMTAVPGFCSIESKKERVKTKVECNIQNTVAANPLATDE